MGASNKSNLKEFHSSGAHKTTKPKRPKNIYYVCHPVKARVEKEKRVTITRLKMGVTTASF